LPRGNVLQVRLRTRAAKAARFRLLFTSFAAALAFLAGLYGVWRGGEWALDRLVFSNSAFNIRRLQIRTDGYIPESTLRRWAGVRSTDNLLALDLEQVRREIERVPFIRSAALHRVFPDTLSIEVEERCPIARICIPRLLPHGGLERVTYFVDEHGFVMLVGPDAHPELAAFWALESLPEITGIDGRLVSPGRRLELPNLSAALRLLQRFEESPMFGVVDLTHLDLARQDSIEGTTSGGSRIVFGLANADEQLLRWRLAHDFAADRGLQIGSIDLSVANNVPLVLAAPAAAPPRPVPVPTSRHRKRHA
jgi:hypothetical protein